jgi:hypothetical protein
LGASDSKANNTTNNTYTVAEEIHKDPSPFVIEIVGRFFAAPVVTGCGYGR